MTLPVYHDAEPIIGAARIAKRLRAMAESEAAARCEAAATPCRHPHPTSSHASCTRFAGHDGDHAAYTWHINQPETWAAQPRQPNLHALEGKTFATVTIDDIAAHFGWTVKDVTDCTIVGNGEDLEDDGDDDDDDEDQEPESDRHR